MTENQTEPATVTLTFPATLSVDLDVQYAFVDGMRVCVVGSVDIVDLPLVLAHTVCVVTISRLLHVNLFLLLAY